MGKYTKTFKIGEYCKGGIITAEVNGNAVTIIGKEWDFSTGSRRSSDQSNAKEFTRTTVLADSRDAEQKLSFFLTDLTTSYYADTVLDWVKTKIKFTRNSW